MAANPSIQLGTDGNWAIKEDNLLAYKKDGDRFFNKEFDFSRGTSATYVDKDGLIKTAGIQPNIVQNGDFETDSDWALTGATINAGKVNVNSSSPIYIIQNSVATIGKTYRVELTVSDYVSGDLRLRYPFTKSESEFTGNGTYVFYGVAVDARVELQGRFSGQTYDYKIDNVSVQEIQTDTPRIDFTNDTKGHLLLEPQSTNLFPHSEDFTQWALGTNSTLTFESNVIAPDGSLGVYRLQNPQTSSTFLSGGFRNCRNFSLFVKAVTEGVNNQFNLDASGQPTDTKTATTQWQRFNRDFGSQANYNLNINNGIDNYASDIYIWGAQAEALSFATSYIPTTGAASTRNAEVCNNSGSAQDFNDSEGVLFAEIAALADDGTYRFISLSSGAFANSYRIGYFTTTNVLEFKVVSGGVKQLSLLYTLSDATETIKVAGKYKANDFSFWVNGFEIDTYNIGAVALGLNELAFDDGSSNLDFYGNTKQVMTFNEALTDAELENLTSWVSFTQMATEQLYTIE